MPLHLIHSNISSLTFDTLDFFLSFRLPRRSSLLLLRARFSSQSSTSSSHDDAPVVSSPHSSDTLLLCPSIDVPNQSDRVPVIVVCFFLEDRPRMMMVDSFLAPLHHHRVPPTPDSVAGSSSKTRQSFFFQTPQCPCWIVTYSFLVDVLPFLFVLGVPVLLFSYDIIEFLFGHADSFSSFLFFFRVHFLNHEFHAADLAPLW